MSNLITTWWTTILAYFAASTAIFSGQFHPISLIATLGAVCGILGLVLAVAWRQVKALWLVVPLALAILTAPVLSLSNTVLSWMGTGFSIFAGALILVLLIALNARDSTRRLPIWLLGSFIFSLAAYSAFIATAQIVATP